MSGLFESGAWLFLWLLLGLLLLPHRYHRGWVLLCTALAIPFLLRTPQRLWEALGDYIALIGSLACFYGCALHAEVSGFATATPLRNVLFLSMAALLAATTGTTTASVLLAPGFFASNRLRRHHWHLVPFFIFVVSNVGGLLTPLGDPPLFLGWQKGVPFTFPLSLLPLYLMVLTYILVGFWLIDRHAYAQQQPLPAAPATPSAWRVAHPSALGVMALLLGLQWLGGLGVWPLWISTWLMLLGTSGYLAWQSPERRHFLWVHRHPMTEMAWVFVGIFATMPLLLEALTTASFQPPALSAWQYFTITGLLSAWLDNAPTYLTMATMAAAQSGLQPTQLAALSEHPNGRILLQAISAGAVMMGALTYLGNAPNLLVYGMAKARHVRILGFFSYFCFAVAFLAPIFIICACCFFV